MQSRLKEIQTLVQLELIPGPWYVPDNLTSGARALGSELIPGYFALQYRGLPVVRYDLAKSNLGSDKMARILS